MCSEGAVANRHRLRSAPYSRAYLARVAGVSRPTSKLMESRATRPASPPSLPRAGLEALEGETRQRAAETLGAGGVDEAHHGDLARGESLGADAMARVVAQHEAGHALEGRKLVGPGGGRSEARREHALDELL